MSPIIHAEIGWLIAQPLKRRRDRALVTVAAIQVNVTAAVQADRQERP